jgi:hypothetical protein
MSEERARVMATALQLAEADAIRVRLTWL